MFIFGLLVGLFLGINLGLILVIVLQMGAANDTPEHIARLTQER